MIQFRSSDMQRYHMKTEWHRYNLKRRIADLPPISADLFAEKLQISEREKQLHEVDEFGFAILKPRNSGRVERKQRSSQKNLTRGRRPEGIKQHAHVIRSLSPASSVASQISKFSIDSKMEIPTDFEEEAQYDYDFTTDSNYTSDDNTSITDSTFDDYDGILVTDCLFCGNHHQDIERNVRHMFQHHGFYIPERSYLIDLPGLLEYFIDLIVLDHECPCCSFEGSSLESIRAHIHSKRHARIPYETKEERSQYSEFYDFSSLSSVRPSEKKEKKTVTFKENDSSGEEDNDQSEIELESSIEDGINSNYSVARMDNSGVELTLPTGTRVGHRAMTRYYRQNLPGPADLSDGNRTLAVADRRFKGGVSHKLVVYGEKKAQQVEKRINNRSISRQMKKGNYQPHYKDEIL